MARLDRADSLGVNAEGKQVTARRERLGLTIDALARESEVSRDTLSDLESGTKDYRRLTLVKIQQALDRLEHEAGINAPVESVATEGERIVKFTVKNVMGAESLVVEFPVRDVDELEEAVDRIMRRLSQGRNEGA